MRRLAHFCVPSAFSASGCLHIGGDPAPIKAQAGIEPIQSASQMHDFGSPRFRPAEPNPDQSIVDKCRASSAEANPPVAVPLVPRALPQGKGLPRKNVGAGTLTLTLAEAGDPPLILESVAGTFNDHGKTIGDFLKDVAKKALEQGSATPSRGREFLADYVARRGAWNQAPQLDCKL